MRTVPAEVRCPFNLAHVRVATSENAERSVARATYEVPDLRDPPDLSN